MANSNRCPSYAPLCAAAGLALSLAALPQAALAVDKAYADVVDADGVSYGLAVFEQAPKGVIVRVDLVGLPPGWHGIHLHAVGRCSPDFKAAKGHVNPAAKQHGLRNSAGPDEGDLPNVYIAPDGSGKAEFYTTRVAIKEGRGTPALLDDDGAAIVVHANADDHSSQPIGGAGGRIGCGVIAEAGDDVGSSEAAATE